MSPVVVAERVAHIAAVRADATADRAALQSALTAECAVRAWLDASNAALVTRLDEVVSFPEQTIADTNRCSLGAASKTQGTCRHPRRHTRPRCSVG